MPLRATRPLPLRLGPERVPALAPLGPPDDGGDSTPPPQGCAAAQRRCARVASLRAGWTNTSRC